MSDLIEITYGETTFDEQEVVDEVTKKATKKFTVEAIVQRADVPNKNNRVYPRAVLEREIKRFQSNIDEGHAFGEADHPKGTASSVTRCAAVFTKLWMERDGTVKAKAVIPETQVGRDVQAIIRAGGRPGWSSRGAGSCSAETRGGATVDVVQEDYRLKTFDCVVNQSVPGAVTTSSRLEHKENTPMKDLTLSILKDDHSEVYTALLAEASATFDASFEEKFLARLEQEKAKIEEQISDRMEESLRAELPSVLAEAVSGPESLLLSLAHLLAENGYAPEGALLSDDEGNEEIDRLEAVVEGLTSRLDEQAKEVADAKLAEDAEAVTAKIAVLTADVAYGKQISEGLASCKTVTEVETQFPIVQEATKALAASFGADPAKLAGKGSIPEAEGDKGGDDADLVEQNRQRAAAGLSPLNG